MSGSTLGTLFRVTTFGESHGPAIGCVVDGCPPGMALSEADIQPELDRRRPGTSRHVTQRQEADKVEILSGVFEGRTTGTPIALLIRNTDQRSKDYANLARHLPPRPRRLHLPAQVRPARSARRRPRVGAADRADGRRRRRSRASGCASSYGTDLRRPHDADRRDRDPVRGLEHVGGQPVLRRQRQRHRRASRPTWTQLRKAGDSCGARIDVVARGVPVGLGEPLYDKLDADIAHAMMGINAVKGVEIGAGFARGRAARHDARRRADARGLRQQQRRRRARRHLDRPGHHGLDRDQADQLDPQPAPLDRPRKASRPTVETFGRHDPCVGIRATPIAEAMLALVLMDHALRHRAQCGDVRVADARRSPPARP